MSWTIQLIIALAIFAAGAAGGIRWHSGQDAIAAQAAQQARESDAIQQRMLNPSLVTRVHFSASSIRGRSAVTKAKASLWYIRF